MSKVWLVTGCSRGLGRSIAEAILAKGHRLLATARNPAMLADLAERFGDQVRMVALDVTDSEAANEAVEVARKAFGRLDVLVNNAGYGDLSSIEETSLEDFRAQIDTNLFGVIHLTKAAIPVMREQGSGHIIQLSSIGGRIGPPGRGAYAAAKWGVEGFSEVLAREVGLLGIKVTIIEPGAFRTDFVSSSTIRPSRPEYASTVGVLADYVQSIHGTQAGDPARAADAILHVASLEDPPLRLLLGSDAVQAAEKSDLARIEADRKWRELSLSTDFEAPSTPYQIPWERPWRELKDVS